MKITEYPTAQFFDENDVLIKDGANGTKQIKASDMVYALFDPIPEMHRQIFRGKSLGSTFTSNHQQAIENGTFHDLWLGDYWESGTIKYRIVDFDYYYNDVSPGLATDSKYTTHHLVIMPDSSLTDTKTVPHNTASSYAYNSSSMRTSSAMSEARSAINGYFGSDHIMTFNDECVFAIYHKNTGFYSIGCDKNYIPMTIEAPSVNQIQGNTNDKSIGGNTNSTGQFSLFSKMPKYISSSKSENYFTRDVSQYTSVETDLRFLRVSGTSIGGTSISVSHNIRPYFCLKG